MTKEEYKQLKLGDIIRLSENGQKYMIIRKHKDWADVVKLTQIVHPDQWILEPEDLLELNDGHKVTKKQA